MIMDLGSEGDTVLWSFLHEKKPDKQHSAIPVANKCADRIKIICMELLELLE
jgi:hypothetical protein